MNISSIEKFLKNGYYLETIDSAGNRIGVTEENLKQLNGSRVFTELWNVVLICTRDEKFALSQKEEDALIVKDEESRYIVIFKNKDLPYGTVKYFSYDTFVEVKGKEILYVSDCYVVNILRFLNVNYIDDETAKMIMAGNDMPTEIKTVLSPVSEIEPVNWLWKYHIPIGELSVIAGKPGQGKTWVALDIAARLSAGYTFPDGSDAPIGKTIYYVGGSEDRKDSIYRRLEGLKAEKKNIRVVDKMERTLTTKDGRIITVEEAPTITTIINSLADACWRFNNEKENEKEKVKVRLVVLDSMTSLVDPGVDIYKSNEVTALMNKLSMKAKELGVAVILIMHHKKGKEDRPDDRVVGSIGFVSSARILWHVDRWKDDPKERIFTQGKNNLCAPQPSYRFCVEPVYDSGDLVDTTTARVNWLGKEDYDANSYEEVKEEKMTMSKKAEIWLRKQLENNTQGLERQEILNRAEGIFNERLLERTIKRIGIVEKNGKVSFWKLKEVGNDEKKVEGG